MKLSKMATTDWCKLRIVSGILFFVFRFSFGRPVGKSEIL